MRYTVLGGRILFSTIFILASAGHFQQQTVDFATWRGVPLAGVLVPLSGVMALMGGLSILVCFQARLGAWVLVAFLIPVTLVMHNFWGVADSAAQQIERAIFMKNLTMLGGALLITYFGACPSRICCQAATGSWTRSLQWETQRRWLRSAGATVCPPAKVTGVWPSNDAWQRAAL